MILYLPKRKSTHTAIKSKSFFAIVDLIFERNAFFIKSKISKKNLYYITIIQNTTRIESVRMVTLE